MNCIRVSEIIDAVLSRPDVEGYLSTHRFDVARYRKVAHEAVSGSWAVENFDRFVQLYDMIVSDMGSRLDGHEVNTLTRYKNVFLMFVGELFDRLA